jgi:hypothetical protein
MEKWRNQSKLQPGHKEGIEQGQHISIPKMGPEVHPNFL